MMTLMLWFLMNSIVWLFYAVVFTVVLSLFVEVSMPGKFKTLHHIYKLILDFDEEDEES